MAHYKQPEITDIFWASNEGFKRGRDPLGIQNSSIATYSTLLPGLTNLTRHIRYYSLYCWLLKEYDDWEKQTPNTLLHQYNFIRRAELAMALIMQDQGIGAVVGALFVSQDKCKIDDNDIYNIADGADFGSKEIYWTYKSGAFGQYYLGSLTYYDLVKVEKDRFYLRDKGKELASALINSVEEDTRALFIKCIKEGRMSKADIERLLPLALHKTKIDSEEWKYLNNLLTKEDKESQYRRDTLYLFLRGIKNGEKVADFPKNRFFNAPKEDNIPASFGWYFYYLCECLHYCLDTIFCLILYSIHDLQNPPLNNLTEDVTERILSHLGNATSFKTIDDYRKTISTDIPTLYEETRDFCNEHEYPNAASHAITLLLRLYTEFENNTKAILEFETKNNLHELRGILNRGMNFCVKHYLSTDLASYVKSLVVKIMQEHTIAAIAKMGSSNSDLRKFVIEDGRIYLVEQRFPVETSPRINSLYDFLKDLGYIDSKDERDTITDIANSFIDAYGKE